MYTAKLGSTLCTVPIVKAESALSCFRSSRESSATGTAIEKHAVAIARHDSLGRFDDEFFVAHACQTQYFRVIGKLVAVTRMFCRLCLSGGIASSVSDFLRQEKLAISEAFLRTEQVRIIPSNVGGFVQIHIAIRMTPGPVVFVSVDYERVKVLCFCANL